MEFFKEIPGFPGYQCGDYGTISSMKHGRIIDLKPGITLRGYLLVTLYKNGEKYTKYSHQLVGETWLENPNNLPTINHIDRNPKNNHFKNLEWSSFHDQVRKENRGFAKHMRPHKNKTSGLPIGIYKTASGKFCARCVDSVLRKYLCGKSRKTIEEAVSDYHQLQESISQRREKYISITRLKA